MILLMPVEDHNREVVHARKLGFGEGLMCAAVGLAILATCYWPRAPRNVPRVVQVTPTPDVPPPDGDAPPDDDDTTLN